VNAPEIRPLTGAHEREAAFALRHAVFVGEQGVPESLEVDRHDGDATHLVAVDGATVVGTVRLVHSGDTVKLGRLAVAPTARRRGLARALLEASEVWAREQGAARIVLSAQTYARGLYAAAGYRASGPTYAEAGIEHVRMERALA
jgi:predicted GNAT family N-acyltransferase